MATDTRDRLIRAAHDLFYQEGFHAVGLDRLLAEVGVTKTTFYNHFGSKDELILAALQWHDDWWRTSFLEMVRRLGGERPIDQLRAIPDALDELFSGPDYNGCMFVNVAVDFPLAHDPAHQAAAAHKQAMLGAIRQLAAYAGAPDPAALAEELALVMEGAYVTVQVSDNDGTTDVARRLVDAILARHIPGA
ncbi:MAG: TetR/AcrR family transcriptional regulator [Phycisphaerales bacterium JB039]